MDESQRNHLLRVAVGAVQAIVQGRPAPEAPSFDWPETAPRGVFVTLRDHGRLRGCIGTLAPVIPLPQIVHQMAMAAVNDPRFQDHPLTPEQLDDLEIELSILSPLMRTRDPLSLDVGRHGIYVKTKTHSGCFLPQVAVEAGWDAATFLSKCCETKARMVADAWRKSDTEVYLFTTERISTHVTGSSRTGWPGPRPPV